VGGLLSAVSIVCLGGKLLGAAFTDRLGGWVVLVAVFAIWIVATVGAIATPTVDIFGAAWLLNSAPESTRAQSDRHRRPRAGRARALGRRRTSGRRGGPDARYTPAGAHSAMARSARIWLSTWSAWRAVWGGPTGVACSTCAASWSGCARDRAWRVCGRS